VEGKLRKKNAKKKKINITVFWEVIWCSLVVRYHYLEDHPASSFMVEEA
jgi:hypothetical protein